MTKADLINTVSAATTDALTKRTVEEVLDLAFNEMRKTIKKEKRFSYPGFGTWTVRNRKARKGVNPQTGAAIKIPASKTVGFKAAPVLKKGL